MMTATDRPGMWSRFISLATAESMPTVLEADSGGRAASTEPRPTALGRHDRTVCACRAAAHARRPRATTWRNSTAESFIESVAIARCEDDVVGYCPMLLLWCGQSAVRRNRRHQ